MALFIAFIAAFTIAGCMSYGSIVVTPETMKKFSATDRLFLDRKSIDSADLHDVLEHKLLQAGFQLKPEIFVKSRDEYLAKAKKGKDIRNDFVLEYSYHSRRTFLIGRTVIDRFDARLIEFESKKKVFDMKFEGKRSVASFADEFVRALLRISQENEATK